MFLEMQNLAVILSLWFAVCAAETVSEPPISMVTPAPDPELVKRQTYDYYGQSDFIGYYAHGSVYTAATCFGTSYHETYLSSKSRYFGGCESSGVYTAFTSCIGNWVYGLYTYSSGIAYSTSKSCYNSCYTNYMIYSPSASTSYFVDCGTTYETFYRAPFTSLPNIGPDSYPTSVITTTRTSPGPSPQPTIPTPPSGSSVSITPLPSRPSPRAKVQIGPIVGGVIGGIAVLLSVIVGIWFCLKKKRQSNVSAHEQSLPVMIPQQPQPTHPVYVLPEKVPVTAQTSPYTPQQQWASSPTSMSPPGSPPPPTYFPQPMHQPPNPQQQHGPFP